jgi:endonuclease/exonuclease/phosphatase family metal-dependent hydrolase
VAEIPNGVISRYPILESGSVVDPEVDNRTFVWARLDVPGLADLWAISVHLLSSNATSRNDEAIALMAFIDATIPDGDLVALGGDFNTDARDEPCLMTFDPAFAVLGPHPADDDGDGDTNSTRMRPYDWVLADDDLRALQIPVVIATSTFASGAVIDTRVYTPISELAPAEEDDSAATGMQHMAVVKDFSLP